MVYPTNSDFVALKKEAVGGGHAENACHAEPSSEQAGGDRA